MVGEPLPRESLMGTRVSTAYDPPTRGAALARDRREGVLVLLQRRGRVARHGRARGPFWTTTSQLEHEPELWPAR